MSGGSAGTVRYSRDGYVGKVLFDHPGAHNALTHRMWEELRDICIAIAKDKDVKVVTFRGVGGKAFVSGSDISDFATLTDGREGITYERGIDEFCGAVEALPQTSIAVIEGWAVGGGLNIASACDFRIATPNSKFGSPVGRTIGNCLAINSVARIAQAVGVNIAKRMVLLGEMITAQELYEKGTLLRLAEPDELDAVVAEVCERAAGNAPLTTKTTKETVRRMLYAGMPSIDDLVVEVYGSNDFKMGVKNFLAKTKTKPDWTGS